MADLDHETHLTKMLGEAGIDLDLLRKLRDRIEHEISECGAVDRTTLFALLVLAAGRAWNLEIPRNEFDNLANFAFRLAPVLGEAPPQETAN